MTSLVRVVLYNPQSFTMPTPHAFMLIAAESGRAWWNYVLNEHRTFLKKSGEMLSDEWVLATEPS